MLRATRAGVVGWLIAVMLLVQGAGQALAAVTWSLVATPPAASTGISTTFTLTATNLNVLQDLGCVTVDLPGSFVLEAAGPPSSPNGHVWSSAIVGNQVRAWAVSGGDRLELLESVTWTLRATGMAAGVWTWNGKGYHDKECQNNPFVGLLPAVVTIAGAPPTPNPTPSPPPTPTPVPTLPPTPPPTPRPTSTPAPIPTPVATAPPAGEPTPTPDLPGGAASSAEPSSGPSDDADGGGTPRSSPGDGGGDEGGTDGNGAPEARPAVTLGNASLDAAERTALGLGALTMLGDSQLWFVPAAVVGIPGLLAIVWIGLQSVGALIWVPAIRRMARQDRRRRGPSVR